MCSKPCMLYLRGMAAQQAHKRQRKERRALDAAREAKVELIAAARHFQKELDEVKTFQREAAEKVSTSFLLATNMETLR